MQFILKLNDQAVDKRFPWLLCCCGVTQKEKEAAASAAEDKKSKMTRMDSVNSTAVGGTQSQLSEVRLSCFAPICIRNK